MLDNIHKSDTLTITRKPDGEYLTVEAPWNKIFEIGKYSNMITIRPSTVEEIIEFNKEREKTWYLSGTTTIFKYNECLARAIELQFEKPICEESSSMEDIIVPEDRFSVIFGRFPQIVSLINKNKKLGAPIVLSNYDYFNGHQTQFYDGLKREKIIFMKNRFERKSGEDIRDKYLFIWESSKDGEKYIIKKGGASWKTKAEKLTVGTHKYDEIGEAEFICAQRKDSEYFDEENPKIPNSASNYFIHPYDKENIGPENDIFLGNMQIYRNDQMLGIGILPGLKISSARGNAESFHKVILTHCALEYYPISTNDNEQDLIIGIQECKTQFNEENIPKNLLNLLAHIRNEKAKEIWNYFEKICKFVDSQQSDGPIKTDDEYFEIVKIEDEYSELDYSDKQVKLEDSSSCSEETDDQIKSDESYDQVNPDKVKSDDKVILDESYDQIKTDESYDKVKIDKSDDQVKPDESYDQIKTDESYDKVKIDKSDDQVKPNESDDKVKPDESDDKVKTNESNDQVKPDESDDKDKPDKSIQTDDGFSEKDELDIQINDIMGIYILSEITKFTSNLDPNMKYTDSSYVELYKLLRRIN
jgi:hypothetical protein